MDFCTSSATITRVDAEAEEMEGLESEIMVRMNLPDPWLGRHLDRELGGA